MVGMVDLVDDEYWCFVCVEIVNVVDDVVMLLFGGEYWLVVEIGW